MGIWRLVLQNYPSATGMSFYLQGGTIYMPDMAVLSLICYKNKTVLSIICSKILHLLYFYRIVKNSFRLTISIFCHKLKLAAVFSMILVPSVASRHLRLLPKRCIPNGHEYKSGFEYFVIVRQSSASFSRRVCGL